MSRLVNVSQKLHRNKTLDNDLGVSIYLVKYERKLYRFTFTFYNNGTQVKRINFHLMIHWILNWKKL